MRALALLALTAAISAPAAADEDPSCARIEEPLAYNACLAAHGPRATKIGGAAGAPAQAHADPEASVPVRAHADPEASAPIRARKPADVFQNVERRHGRIHMEFRLR